MKIHIDTSSEKKNSPTSLKRASTQPSPKAPKNQPYTAEDNKTPKLSKGKPPKPMDGKPSPKTTNLADPLKNTTTAAPKPNLAKSPPKEPKPPKDVAAGRKLQTKILSERMRRETQGNNYGSRDVDAGAGFWPPLNPLL